MIHGDQRGRRSKKDGREKGGKPCRRESECGGSRSRKGQIERTKGPFEVIGMCELGGAKEEVGGERRELAPEGRSEGGGKETRSVVLGARKRGGIGEREKQKEEKEKPTPLAPS